MSTATIIAIDSSTGQPLTPSSTSDQHSSTLSQWQHSSPTGKPLETRLFYPQPQSIIAAIGIGKKQPKTDEERAERTRKLAATGALAVKEKGAKVVRVDTVWSAHAAAEGAALATFNWSLKTKKDSIEKKERLTFEPLTSTSSPSHTHTQPTPPSSSTTSNPNPNANANANSPIPLTFQTGLTFAAAQNLARTLMELPANLCTPTKFCEKIESEFKGLDNVEIFVRDKAWAEEKGMRTFLSVAAGTDEPCKFLEIHYKGSKSSSNSNSNSKGEFKPSLALVGKGITFDSGGISLKPGAGMKAMRADMGGAAVVTSTLHAVAALGLPIDLLVVCPLTENLPSGKATKPGDVVVAMNGKTVEVDNTDAEGRLVLSDALWYVSEVYKPATVIDVATLTGAMMIALGEAFAGVFSTSDELWRELEAAGKAESDPFWRMPFDDAYMKQIDSTNADLCNTGGRIAGSCTAAIFLREFVAGLKNNAPEEKELEEDEIRYAHIDIAGVMENTIRPEPYNTKGMSGRPVRSLIEFVRQLSAASTAT